VPRASSTEVTATPLETPTASRGSALAIRWVCPNDSVPPTPLDGRQRTIGRAEECDAVLPGREISRRHAELGRTGPVLIIRNAGSHNGVFVNGSLVEEAPLERGDVVRLGEWVGVVADVAHDAAFGELIAGLVVGPTLHACLEGLPAVAKSSLPIVLEGEPGTGKERVAAAIHAWSGRAGRIVALNCAAIPETLAESELFGHLKGAFTGADRPGLGLIRAADGGTLFLDEVVELSRAVQAKLLRVVEQQEVVPVGETEPVHVDVRVVAATHEPLERAVADGRFRGDLFSRLAGRTLRLPPLRERREEIPGLFQALLARRARRTPPSLDARLVETLCLADWPYNVRDLDLLAERLLAENPSADLLRRSHLPPELLRNAPAGARPAGAGSKQQREIERLTTALGAHRGNIARAAAAVGISRQRAYRLIRDAGIDLAALRAGSE
jgi:transcriptional regulator with PAS, ATPase and Fis domain